MQPDRLLYNLSHVIFIIYLLWKLPESIFFLWLPGVCVWTHWTSFYFIGCDLHLCEIFFLVKYSKDLYKHSQDKAFLFWRTSSRNSNIYASDYFSLSLGTMLTAMRNMFSLEGSDVILLKSSEPPPAEVWLSFLTLNFPLMFHLAITRSSKADWIQTGLYFFFLWHVYLKHFHQWLFPSLLLSLQT